MTLFHKEQYLNSAWGCWGAGRGYGDGKELSVDVGEELLETIKWDCNLAGVGDGRVGEWDRVNSFRSCCVSGTVLGTGELAINRTVPYSLGDRIPGAGKLRTVRGVVLGRSGECRIS